MLYIDMENLWDKLYPFLEYILYRNIEDFLIDSREKGREDETEGEKYQCERNINLLPLACTLTGDWTRNPGMCSDWELNQQPLGLQDDAQPTEPHQTG